MCASVPVWKDGFLTNLAVNKHEQILNSSKHRACSSGIATWYIRALSESDEECLQVYRISAQIGSEEPLGKNTNF